MSTPQQPFEKVAPEVRILAHRLNVDLTIVTPSGPDDTITAEDVQRVHQILTEIGPVEVLEGGRLSRALAMAHARDDVAQATVCEDAVLHAWKADEDCSVRLVRALAEGVKAEPALNAWFDAGAHGCRRLPKIHLGITVATREGHFVCVLQDVAQRNAASLRAGLDKMKQDTRNRSVPADQLRGYSITLSNLGPGGGRYAAPAILPPTVAHLVAGGVREAVVPIKGEIRIARVLPLSLSYDQRAVSGDEAVRGLAAIVADLQKPA